jgi:hypothetical protein
MIFVIFSTSGCEAAQAPEEGIALIIQDALNKSH